MTSNAEVETEKGEVLELLGEQPVVPRRDLGEPVIGDHKGAGLGSDAEANSPVVLVLPDNSRDPELTQVLRDAQEKYFARKRQ